MDQVYGAVPPEIVKERVPSVPSEQVVGVVVTFVIASSWADSEIMEVARDNISNMVYLNAFIWTQIRAVLK